MKIAEAITAFLVGMALAWLIMGFVRHASAHDDGRYASHPLHDWFKALASKKGMCCDFADGLKINEPDWRSKDGHYEVLIPRLSVPQWGSDGQQHYVPDKDTWVIVPNAAVITEPNLSGETWVWPYSTYYDGPGIQIRCFLPGAGT